MIALTVAAEPEQPVLNIGSSILVQVGEVVSKELPLCELAGRWLRQGRVGGVGAVDEAEICGCEVERGSVRGIVVLKEYSSHGREIEVGRSCSQRGSCEQCSKSRAKGRHDCDG